MKKNIIKNAIAIVLTLTVGVVIGMKAAPKPDYQFVSLTGYNSDGEVTLSGNFDVQYYEEYDDGLRIVFEDWTD